ncbi:MAG TPA: glycosyl hydrolase family 18 protein [Treponemataceae bacterium]|mgnify:FL=1|nr:glycosyl hydrolase family 18 protein [Treponemataceae bacterium]
MKYFVGLLLLVFSSVLFASTPVDFAEVWAYLLSGEELALDESMPITDIGYFGAGLNSFGELVGVPDRAKLARWNGRVHLVIAEVSNPALSHFSLNPEYGIRDGLIRAIADAAKDFDGVQIDFETVASPDREQYLSFLKAIKASIGDKILSVALPARTKKIKNDVYDYKEISRIADRIIVMAYDEHWSGSAAGPIASIDWCARVAAWARSKIGKDKLVMGLPFYGRAWGDVNPSKAYRFSTLSNLMNDKSITDVKRSGDIPWFEYEETVRVKVYYEDFQSIFARSRMYRDAKVQNIAFWRLGQEDPGVWNVLRIQ